jgi:glycerate kinase
MPLRVLVAPDKFKGTLTASQAADAIARGWKEARPQDQLALLPISDGGDGFGEVINSIVEGEPQTLKTVDAAHRPCTATWWWHAPTKTAIVESARVIGLAQLPPAKYHPFELDTCGLGEVLRTAAEYGASRCIVGIGGSATNDAGFGLATSLGWQFFNTHDEKILRWTELHSLAQVRPPERHELFPETIVAVDVQNPLLGPNGCTRVYGPQKGLRAEDFEFAERCLEQLAQILEKELHLNCAAEPGAGAAGGLGYGLRCFTGARLAPGFRLFAEYAHLEERLAQTDLILTGEGAIDASTLMGKGTGELAALCRNGKLPCIGFAGVMADVKDADPLFTSTHSLAPGFVNQDDAMREPAKHLQALSRKVAFSWS